MNAIASSQAPPRAASAGLGWMRPALTRLLREVAGGVQVRRGQGSLASTRRERASTAVPRCEPQPWLSATAGVPARPSQRERLAAAERELARVHLVELAFLLREASRLRRERSSADEALACREGLAEALECARLDGLSLAAGWVALARACLATPCEAWPSASTLARVALRIEPCEAGRAALARALLAEGDPRGARSALAAALLSCPSPRRGAGLLEELASVEAGLGHGPRASLLRGWAARAREVA